MITRRACPFDVIARALAERLHGRHPSAELRAIVRSRNVDWERVVGHASAHFVLPAFAAALRDLGLTESLDQDLGAFLEAIHAANLERNGDLREELTAAVGVLNRAGIQPVLLKGAIRLVDGLYPDDGWRVLRDLDLLVPKASLAEAIQAFEQAGYAACRPNGQVRRRGACQIDLHSELFSAPRQMRLLAAVNVLNEARPLALAGGHAQIPSVEHQLVHLIGHSQIRHLGHALGRLSLRERLETAALVQWGQEGIDWQAVSARFVAAGYRRPLLSSLLSLNRTGWCAVPVTGRIDPLTAMQQRRIALQARSTTFAYIGSRVGWLISALRSQIEESDGGKRKGLNHLRRLISEPGAIRRMARVFCERRQQLMQIPLYLTWLIAQ